MNRPFAGFFAWSFIVLVSEVSADTVRLTPVADAALLESFPTNNLGGQAWMNAGTTQTYLRNRALLKFAVAQSLPAHARVQSVSLTLEATKSPVDGDTPSTFDLHRVLRDWGEGRGQGYSPVLGAPAGFGECDWTHRFALTDETWAEPGGAPGVDFLAEPSGETFVYGVNFSPYVFDSTSNLVADVQGWQREPAKNFGWMLKTRAEEENFSARRFASREDPFRAPVLTIDYELPRIDEVAAAGDAVEVRFHLEPGESADLEACDALAADGSSPSWQVIASVVGTSSLTYVVVTDGPRRQQRFYRLAVR